MYSSDRIVALEGSQTHFDVIVVGSGQAGMSMSYCLQQQGIDHIVLEKNSTIAKNWKEERWEEFCLVTPNWQCQLPGHFYSGDDPNGFMVKDEIVDYLESYFNKVRPPIRFNSPVRSLTKTEQGFEVRTSTHTYTATQVVLACGSYHKTNILPFSQSFPESILQIHSKDYKDEKSLPEGEVMVVGTGQSGCQIAEDLHLSGRKVHLCVGSAPRVNRRYRGRDVVDWLEDMGYYETTIDKHPDGENAPHSTNHYVTGRDGGRDLNLRIFAEQGMNLYGKIRAAQNGILGFEADLKENLDYADAVAKRIRDSIEKYIQSEGINAPEDENEHSDYTPPSPESLNLNTENITSVVWATGFSMDFEWVKIPVFNEKGLPIHKRGITGVDGLYFLGLNWMNTWGSGRFFHVGRDAQFLAEKIASKAHNYTRAMA